MLTSECCLTDLEPKKSELPTLDSIILQINCSLSINVLPFTRVLIQFCCLTSHKPSFGTPSNVGFSPKN